MTSSSKVSNFAALICSWHLEFVTAYVFTYRLRQFPERPLARTQSVLDHKGVWRLPRGAQLRRSCIHKFNPRNSLCLSEDFPQSTALLRSDFPGDLILPHLGLRQCKFLPTLYYYG